MKRAFALALFLGLAASVCYGAPTVFQNGQGATALAMGGAFVAIADDFSAPLWNPAGLLLSYGESGIGMWAGGSVARLFSGNGFDGITYNYASFASTAFDGSVAMAGSYAFTGADQLYSSSLLIATARVAVQDLASFGLSVKQYAESISGDHAGGTGFDAGVLWVSDFGLRLGASATDLLGTDIGDGHTVATTYRLGAAYTTVKDIVDTGLTVAMELEAGQSTRLRLGLEGRAVLAFRCGVSIPIRGEGDVTITSFGLGLDAFVIKMNFAYILDGPLGHSWIVDFSVML